MFYHIVNLSSYYSKQHVFQNVSTIVKTVNNRRLMRRVFEALISTKIKINCN